MKKFICQETGEQVTEHCGGCECAEATKKKAVTYEEVVIDPT